MKLYNTLTRRLEEFTPLEGNLVRLYTCGPTVYLYAHVGNFRAYAFEDLLRRHLKFSGYDVMQVMNITDIDDKTIRGAREQNKTLKEYTAPYIEAFFEDLDALGIERAEAYPAATDYIPEMIELINRLFENGLAYQSDDGSVYFNVNAFEGYGKLAHLDREGMRSGVRVLNDEYEKDDVADFALWKAWDEADGDVGWDSPWGRGRPGWHIECSAMGMKLLGETFDIHTGGIDNLFPHHENEIAQAEGATGKPFVKCWLHCGYLQVEGRKMSKSLGNFFTLRELQEKGYEGREVRYVLLSGHYRQPLNFTIAALDAARVSLRRIDDFSDRLEALAGDEAATSVPGWASDGLAAFTAALDDDLNIAGGLGALFDMIHAGNRAMDAGDVDAGAASAALEVLKRMDIDLGLLRSEDVSVDSSVEELLEKRLAARTAKDWAASDAIRDQLAALGWEVRDTAEGQQVKRK